MIEYIDYGYINVQAVPMEVDGMGTFERWESNSGERVLKNRQYILGTGNTS